ncbi:MAG TPA: DnaB-like helicase C-terminal domain-containing protein [Smithellaceae bacterium]|nr:DnaB-like helicase C-terminal domain-containing protein [Smithellaceae bacterium]
MTAIEYIQSKGIDYKIQSGQAVLNCFFCGDTKGHLYIDQQDGAFFCHKCNERGNLITLQKHFGDYQKDRPQISKPYQKSQAAVKPAFEDQGKRYYPTIDDKKAIEAHQRLLNNEPALKYVTETRGLCIETVKAFKIGLQIDKDGGQWLTIPHHEKGKLINIKSRSLPPTEKTFRRVKDCLSILFNSDCLETYKGNVYLCEGEIDALSLWDKSEKNVIATTTGAGSFDPAWIDQLKDVKKIIIVYDPDEPGQKGAREVARRLGYDRCFNVILPDGKDLNEYFMAGNTIADFIRYVSDNARQFDVAGVMTFDDGLRKYQEECQMPEQARGLRTGWPSLDKTIKTGFMPGELIVLSAPPKIGKSTLALQIVSYNALQDIPALFFCLEMRPMKIIQKITQCHVKSEEIGLAEIERTRIDFKGKPLYLGYCYQKPTLENIIETIKAAIRRYGLRLVVFDHLHFLCRSITNQVQEVGLAVQAFKFLAEELEVPVILIAQPRKMQADSIMTAMDLKDSSSIYSDCDHLILMHRARKVTAAKDLQDGAALQTESFDPMTLVRVEASRYNSGGETVLFYHGEYSRFDEVPGAHR